MVVVVRDRDTVTVVANNVQIDLNLEDAKYLHSALAKSIDCKSCPCVDLGCKIAHDYV